MTQAWPHTPVLLDEVVAALAPEPGDVLVDCTLGMGGHTEALLESAPCQVIGIDRDPEAIAIASERLARFGDRFQPCQARFGDLADVVARAAPHGVDGVLADLGVSSLQLDEPGRGFSFQREGPVDMRMDPTRGPSAASLVDTWSVDDLRDLFRELGEERYAGRIAAAIVAARPFDTTLSLARVVEAAVPAKARHAGRVHPATRVFQALRMAVNEELDEIDRFLPAAVQALRPGGRLAVIAFHSLEDRKVKRFFDQASGYDAPRDPFGDPIGRFPLSTHRKAVKAAPQDPNPRARSARLRVARRNE